MAKPAKLILLRHGQSEWNRLNLFTGWVDIPLSFDGVKEAIDAGRRIADIPIDIIFVSSLIRSQLTGMIAMSEHKSGKVPVVLHPGEGKLESWAKIHDDRSKENTIPVIEAWEINERMYGDLQGLNKQETRERYGDEQVKIWRRSFDTAPPNGESLADTAARSIPYFKNNIVPHLQQGRNVFVSAHGNSLRAIIMHLDNLTKEQVLEFEIPTGVPIIYNFHDDKWEKVVS